MPFNGQIWFMSQREASEIANAVARRNVFARHSWENNFYFRRAQELAEKTVVEIDCLGDPADIYDKAALMADRLEKLAVVSTAVAVSRRSLHRDLGVAARSPLSIDFVIGPDYRYLRSTRPRASRSKGVLIDATFNRRYNRCGFPALADLLVSNSGMASRVASTVDWLFQSRMDPVFHAAITKTAVSLESLLIASEFEPLAHSLSERAALILSQDPSIRPRISRIIKNFYDARSSVVHGNAKKTRSLKSAMLEAVDRLVLLLCLQLAANSALWHTADAMRDWCEQERWGPPAPNVISAFPERYLRDAVSLAEAARA